MEIFSNLNALYFNLYLNYLFPILIPEGRYPAEWWGCRPPLLLPGVKELGGIKELGGVKELNGNKKLCGVMKFSSDRILYVVNEPGRAKESGSVKDIDGVMELIGGLDG